jgi:prophage regulatory protein
MEQLAETTGLLRLPQVLALIPVSKTAWYAGIASGLFPAPIKLGTTSLWSVESIRAAIANLTATQRGTLEAAS